METKKSRKQQKQEKKGQRQSGVGAAPGPKVADVRTEDQTIQAALDNMLQVIKGSFEDLKRDNLEPLQKAVE
ncbi:hypothetical protein scyTo_0004565 [Scyliorhinus torazame]|uniref:Uncharacterized protein n=1 Tax=Scyliorhinus torazame TaxID=75743 RepID=A0A401NTL7_SCYTO|nr:hypothetical protein [Scyliorhinus torazame]